MELTAEQQQRLASIKLRSSRYEVVAYNLVTKERKRVCYTRRTLSAMWRYVTNPVRAHIIAKACGADHTRPVLSTDRIKSPGVEVHLAIGDWTIGWSRRTEREAIMAGELPWIGDGVLVEVTRNETSDPGVGQAEGGTAGGRSAAAAARSDR